MSWIEPINILGTRWRWYYVEADDKIYRVKSPLVLLALWLGWRPRPALPRATIAR